MEKEPETSANLKARLEERQKSLEQQKDQLEKQLKEFDQIKEGLSWQQTKDKRNILKQIESLKHSIANPPTFEESHPSQMKLF